MNEKTYAQVVGYIVNLVGGSEVGLPNPNTICIDITEMEPKPNVGDAYADGEFMSQEAYYEKYIK